MLFENDLLYIYFDLSQGKNSFYFNIEGDVILFKVLVNVIRIITNIQEKKININYRSVD